MTCVVGLEHEGRVWIGGDSAGVAGTSITLRSDTKVWAAGGWAFGFTTSFRMGQILRYSLRLPDVDTWDLDAFMATRFIDEVRGALSRGGWVHTEQGRESGGTFLVGTAGRLYQVDSDFQIGRSLDGYDAVGCGQDLALGSLYTSTGLYQEPEVLITVALEAAAHHYSAVARPFTVVSA